MTTTPKKQTHNLKAHLFQGLTLALLALAAGCGGKPITSPTSTVSPVPTSTISPIPTVSPVPSSTMPPTLPPTPIVMEDQQRAVRVILGLSPNELGDVCKLDEVACDSQGNVIELDLPDNGLTSLPSEIGGLTNLQVLGLSDNQLTSLPP